jgi:two-component system OmpR family sensor kinase
MIDFSIFDIFENPVLQLETTKIINCNKSAKNWEIFENSDLMQHLTFDKIDVLIDCILNEKYFEHESNIYFMKGSSKYCKIKYEPKHSILHIQDRTQFQLIKKVKSDFITSLSHELRTPMSVAKGNAHILEDFLEEEKYKGYVKKISLSLNKLERILNQLTMLSMAEFGSYSIKHEILDPQPIYEEVINDLNKKIMTKNIQLEFILQTKTLKADRFIFYTLLRNLISNSTKYSYENSKIIVKISEDEIVVQDSGIGVRDEEKERIFERFYRSSEALQFAKGSGLGLAIVKHFCELSNYKIEFDSKWMIGTTFKIKLK